MSLILLALIPPFLLALANFIDRFLMVKLFQGKVGALAIFGGLAGFLISAGIFLVEGNAIFFSLSDVFWLILAGLVYVGGGIPWLYSVGKEDASLLVPYFQLIPVFSLFLGVIIFQEFLTFSQILGGAVILSGTFVISLNFKKGLVSFKKRIASMMILSAFLYTLYSVFFKLGASNQTFWAASFWFYFGLGCSGLLLLLYKPYRQEFSTALKIKMATFLTVAFTGEGLNLLGVVISTFTFLIGPLAVVWVLLQIQPLFVFVIGLIITLAFPKILSEDISKKILIQKGVAILIIIIGSIILQI
jgi:uncharacterized membrane protein